ATARRRATRASRHDEHIHRALSVFLDPKLIHAGERVRLFGLQGMPAIEIAHETIAAENVPIMLHDPRREFETDEFQVALDDEGLDVRNRQPAFLDMEQQVAALAGAEEVAEFGNAAERRVQQLLPAAADVVRGRAIASRENEGAGGNDLTACRHPVEGPPPRAPPA